MGRSRVPGGKARAGREDGVVVPDAEPTSYYGHPVIKPPVWTPEIPVYLLMGGVAGGSAALAALAEAAGNEQLARRAWANALAAVTVSPVLLISDLGRPARFFNMLRMFKVTSPMSVGSWILAASGMTTTLAAADAWTGLVPAGIGRPARVASAVLGLPLGTYTAALLANTAVPVWHESRTMLPFVFASASAATAGAAALVTTPAGAAAPARRLTVGGGAASLVLMQAMEHRLGDLKQAYRTGRAGALKRASVVLTAAGAGIAAAAGRRRLGAVAGGALVLAGAACERFSIFRAGFQSADDPAQTVGPQRRGIEAGARHGASRRGAGDAFRRE